MEIPNRLKKQSIIFFKHCQTFFVWAPPNPKVPKIGFQKLFDRDMDRMPNWMLDAGYLI